MRENFTSINVIIDESGSMAKLSQETISGFNKFLADQKALPGEAVLTLCTFNYKPKTVHDFVKLGSVSDLSDNDYIPNGGTALLDAVGTVIESVGQKLHAMPEDEKPSKVLFLIITDGEENLSKEFSKAKVKAMIEHQREKYNWEFVFLGANIDSMKEGSAIGVNPQLALNYVPTAAGTKGLFENISRSTTHYRRHGTYQVSDSNNTGKVK